MKIIISKLTQPKIVVRHLVLSAFLK